MDFNTYIEKTRETAVYPENYERDYVIHGLVDELGELMRISQEVQGSVDKDIGSTTHVTQVCKEMGDAMWYLARLADHFNFDLIEHFEEPHEVEMNLEEGQARVQEAFLQAAKINGFQKKSVRDDADKVSHIEAAAANILFELRKAAHHFGLFDLRVVMRRNIEKLFDRKARNVIHGDGDNR